MGEFPGENLSVVVSGKLFCNAREAEETLKAWV